MPILGPEIRRKMPRRFGEKPLPYKVGEEGVVYRIPGVDRSYIAKQWYGSQEKKLVGDPDDEHSPSSPYWAKLKYYEYKLIHQARPEFTLKMVASFDERITKNQETGEWDFSYSVGRPVTVSEEVDADPELLAQRDAITDPQYRFMLDYHARTRHGQIATPAQRQEFYRNVAEVDERLEAVLGRQQLLLPLARELREGESLRVDVDHILEVVQSGLIADNGNPVSQLLRYGIFAIHPHLNFIPTGRDNEGKVKGTYIELALVYPPAYYRAMRAEHGEAAAQKALPALERFQRYKMLDALYDTVVMPLWLSGNALIHTKRVRNSIFHVCEAVRRKCEEANNSILESLFEQVRTTMIEIISEEHSEGRAVHGLEELKRAVDEAVIVQD